MSGIQVLIVGGSCGGKTVYMHLESDILSIRNRGGEIPTIDNNGKIENLPIRRIRVDQEEFFIASQLPADAVMRTLIDTYKMAHDSKS